MGGKRNKGSYKNAGDGTALVPQVVVQAGPPLLMARPITTISLMDFRNLDVKMWIVKARGKVLEASSSVPGFQAWNLQWLQARQPAGLTEADGWWLRLRSLADPILPGALLTAHP